MFLLIMPQSGNIITHEAKQTLSVYADDGSLLVVVDGNPHTYSMADVVTWQAYQSRQAALTDRADLRDYPPLR